MIVAVELFMLLFGIGLIIALVEDCFSDRTGGEK